jgi:hypothetical protein
MRRDKHLGGIGRASDAYQARNLALEAFDGAGEAGHRVFDLLGDWQELLGCVGGGRVSITCEPSPPRFRAACFMATIAALKG